MKKKLAVWIGLFLGVLILFNVSPQEAEASSKPKFFEPNVSLVSATKQTKTSLKGEVSVELPYIQQQKYAKIVVEVGGTRYYDSCAKLLRTEVVYHGKDTFTFKNIYKFSGCRTTKY